MNSTVNAIAYVYEDKGPKSGGPPICEQTLNIDKYCKAKNINILRYYQDTCSSGSYDSRIELKHMLSDISQDASIDRIIVSEIGVLSKSLARLSKIFSSLEDNNTALISVTQEIDTSNPNGQLFVWLCKNASADKIKRIEIGMERRALSGKWNGGKLLGYASNEDKELEIVEDEADIVKEIFHLLTCKGWACKRIASHLNGKGCKTSRGNDWSASSIRRITSNPIYAGYIRWGKQGERILSEGSHPPIISRETWEKSVEIRKLKKNKIKDTPCARWSL